MIATELMNWLPGIISSIFGGSIVAAIVALYKVKPEAGQIVVTAAQGALLVQTGVIENLKKEVERLNAEVLELKAELSKRDTVILQLQSQLLQVKGDQDRHEQEIHSLCTGGKNPLTDTSPDV